MIKYFCDRCGKETKKNAKVVQKEVARGGISNSVMFVFDTGILCEDCAEKFNAIKDRLEHEEDIFGMSDEDIELLRYTFKVGDKVITAEGRTGTVTDICRCDRCKERGFYETTVTFDNHREYISISDKNYGFKSYYSIGDRVFGNLDEKSVCKEMDAIAERQRQLILQWATIRNLQGEQQ